MDSPNDWLVTVRHGDYGKHVLVAQELGVYESSSRCECWTGKEDSHQDWCPGRDESPTSPTVPDHDNQLPYASNQ